MWCGSWRIGWGFGGEEAGHEMFLQNCSAAVRHWSTEVDMSEKISPRRACHGCYCSSCIAEDVNCGEAQEVCELKADNIRV
jgi:hypothetical protein